MPKVLTALSLLALASPAWAGPGAGNFNLVNGTSGALGTVSISRTGAKSGSRLVQFRPQALLRPYNSRIPIAPLTSARKVGGKAVTWAGVNLCDVKSVTLKRDDSAGAWVDYDQ